MSELLGSGVDARIAEFSGGRRHWCISGGTWERPARPGFARLAWNCATWGWRPGRSRVGLAV
eukprot:2902786-Pyramimonas_sp.AAC.2